MKRWLLLPLLAAALVALPSAASVQEKMVTYYLVLLKKGPKRPVQPTPQDAEIQKQHLAHLEKLHADGVGVAAGPFGDDGEIRGIVVMRTTSSERAKELAEADPAVKVGRLAVEVLAFLSPEGWFHKPAEPFSMEQLHFGFLKAGPDRSQDPESARRLQAEHLAYMNDQHAQSKLVLAGPITEGGGDRRGIVVYRVASAEDARSRAEGDPMVKAGRLAVELHPWYVAKGVLK